MKTKRGIWRTVQSILFFVLICTATVYAQNKSIKNTEKEFGWIKVDTNLDSVYVVIDRQFQNARLVTNREIPDSVKAETGAHTVTLVWKTIHDYNATIDVFTDETSTVNYEIYNLPQYPQSSYNVIKQQYNLEISSAENTEIYVNGQFAGVEKARVLQLHNYPVVKIIHPDHGRIEYTAEVTTFRTTEVGRYYSDNNKRSWYYYTIPLWKQGYHNEYGKMTLAGFSYIAFGALTYKYELDIADKRSNYNKTKKAYLDAPNAWRTEQHKQVLKNNLKKLKDAIELQNLMIGGIVATYALGVIDALFIRPREGYHGRNKYRSNSKISSMVPDVSVGTQNGMTIGLTWSLQ